MVTLVQKGGDTDVSGPEALFSVQGFVSGPDGQRFVMIRRGRDEAGELIVVENFFEQLKAKVGN